MRFPTLQRILGLAACGVLFLGLPLQAQAQTLQIGYTDHELIIVNMPDYRTVQETLRTEFEGSQQEFQAKVQDFQERVDRYQKQQALLSEERRVEREQELTALQQEIQQLQQNAEQQLSEREAELLAPIFERVNTAIQEVAKEKNLDIVLRTTAGPLQPIILYVNQETIVDITPDVARKLGLDVDAESTEGTAASN